MPTLDPPWGGFPLAGEGHCLGRLVGASQLELHLPDAGRWTGAAGFPRKKPAVPSQPQCAETLVPGHGQAQWGARGAWSLLAGHPSRVGGGVPGRSRVLEHPVYACGRGKVCTYVFKGILFKKSDWTNLSGFLLLKGR